MNEERAKASFDIRALTLLMDGGQKQTDVNNQSHMHTAYMLTPEIVM